MKFSLKGFIAAVIVCVIIISAKYFYSGKLSAQIDKGICRAAQLKHVENLYIGSSMFRKGINLHFVPCVPRALSLLSARIALSAPNVLRPPCRRGQRTASLRSSRPLSRTLFRFGFPQADCISRSYLRLRPSGPNVIPYVRSCAASRRSTPNSLP